jgi:hypothetical protein
MASKSFLVSDLNELYALHRVFREAKFCTEPDDVEVSPSPIVAKLFERVMTAIIAASEEAEGERARDSWARWINMDDEERDEWKAALLRAKRESDWHKFSNDKRREYATLLFAPFKLSSEKMNRFISQVAES